MKKWLDKYKSKGEVKNAKNPIKLKEVVIKANKPVYQYTPQNLVAPTFSNLSQTTYGVTPYGGTSKKLEVIKNNNKKRPKIKLQNQIFASNTRENVLDKRRNYYFPYETEQTKNIRNLADEKVFQSSGDLISAVHPVGAVINALVEGADQSLFAEGFRFLPNKVPFKNAKTYNSLIPFLKPASKAIDLIQMFDKLHTADSLYNSADSIDLYNQFKNGGLVSKNSLNRKVTCSNCGWSWKLSDGGEDPLTCHKCGGTIKMKNGGELDKYQKKGEVKSTFNPYANVNRVSSSDGTRVFRLNPKQVENAKKAAAIKNEKIVKGEVKSTFNPYANINRIGTSDNTKVFRLNPKQVENAKKAAAIKNEKIVKEYLQNNQSFIGPDNRTKAERDRSIAARKAYDDLMEKQQVMTQQPIYQFLQNTTPGGYNPNAAYNPVIGNTSEALGYMAAGALGSSVARPAFNFMGEAMNAPIQGIPGLTGNNIVNAGFATHGLKSIMDGSVAKPWKEARKTGNPWDYVNAVNENLMTAMELAPLVGPGYRGALEAGSNVYNNIATGNSIIPYAWKSPAVELSQNASDVMFKGLFNSNKLTDAERALIVEYQHDSKPFTGRGGFLNQEKKEALNNIIKKYNLNFNNNSILTRRFNPENQSLGADFVNNNLNLRDRPSSFSAGVGVAGYKNSMDRLVIPNRYAKKMGNNFLANEYGILSDDAFNLVDPKVKNFAYDIGRTNTNINAEREVIGTGLNFKRIGKIKNDIGGYDHVVKPTNANGNLIWEKPNVKQLSQEYDIEHELKNLNLFKNKDEFINAVKNAKVEEITKDIDNLISNRSRTTSKKDLLSLSMTYKSYPKYRNEKTIEAIYNTLNLGGKMDMPIILEFPNGKRRIFSGNTRMDLSFQSGINPKALIIKVPIKKQEGGAIITDRGQWDYPGQTTIIPSNQITMQGVPYPVTGVDNLGNTMVMQPGINYTFPGQYVTEYPIMQYGGQNTDWEIIG